MGLLTPRLHIRPPEERDRERFVELFRDPDFMVFSDGANDERAANERFEHLLAFSAEVPFAKQPIIERDTGEIVGYVGVDRIDFEDGDWLEFGYRLASSARGAGYATEAGRALLASAAKTFQGELLAIIHPTNLASVNVATKLGFTPWKQGPVFGEVRELLRQTISG